MENLDIEEIRTVQDLFDVVQAVCNCKSAVAELYVVKKLDEIPTLHRSSYQIASRVISDALVELGN